MRAMSNEYQFESPEFRQHIRALLYEYSITHYTTNYIDFTECLVSELLQDLKPVPLTDPYSFVIPVDPFQTFCQIHAVSSLPPYDEILQTTNEARLYLKKVMQSTQGVPKTSRLEWSEAACNYFDEPFFPALTRKSRKKTRRLGKGPSGPRHLAALAKLHKLEPIAVEAVVEEKLDFEGLMKVKHHINPSELPAVQSILKKTADSMRHMPLYKNRYLDSEFLCKIKLKAPEIPEEQFMPIFPRSRLPGSGATHTSATLPGLKNFADFPSVLDTDIKVEDIEGDLSMQNLVIVSGWQAIQSSPPSTPSNRVSDSEDEHDQLLFPSPPNREPSLAEEIDRTQMEVLIPRSRQIGGTSGITPHILAGKTLQSFIQPLLIPTESEQEYVARTETNAEEQHTLNMSSTSSSLLGQAASAISSSDAKNSSIEVPQARSLDDDLKQLYQGHSWNEAILKEPLDDQKAMLMEVPTLPEPNVHPPNEMNIPKSLAEFVVPTSRDKQGSNPALTKPEPAYQFLKKARGKQALSLALSWVPFTVDKRLPSLLELVGVADLFEPTNTPSGGQSLQEVADAEKLIKSLDFTQDDGHSFFWTNESTYRPVEPPEEFRLLLNRQERRRIAKPGVYSDDVDMDPELDGISQTTDNLHEDEREVVRPRVDARHNKPLPSPQAKRQRGASVPMEGIVYDDEEEQYECAVKRPRLELYYDSSSPLLSAYEEHRHEHIDSGYESPGAYFSEENKENYPPLSSSFQAAEDGGFRDQHWDNRVEYDLYSGENQDQDDGGSFEPLSIDSRYIASGATQGMEIEYEPENIAYDQQDTSLSKEIDSTNSGNGDASMNLQDEFIFEPDMASHSLGILSFARLRARKVSEPTAAAKPDSATVPVAPSHTLDARKGAPQDIFDKDTIVVSGPIAECLSIHRYMASLEFIQKHGLVRALRSEECAVELVERQTLGGVDLIVDPCCAVLFISLFTLPARCAADVERVAQQSRKFSRLLVIFEAYPENCSKRLITGKDRGPGAAGSELYAYTPPILKAIKKFRRDINIADACGTKRSGTTILYGFADSVQDAALITRVFGCQAEERDETSGVIWGERPWLSAEFIEEEEQALAAIKGMNHFSASMILSQVTLGDYLDLLPEERMEVCSGLIAREALAECSADIESRFQIMNASSSL